MQDTKDSTVPYVSCTECSKPILSSDIFVKKLRKTFCSDCWIHHCNFRFRKRIFELGKPDKGSNTNLLLAPTETVLIYYDGSPSSVALINLLRDAVHSSATKDNIPQRNLPFPFNFIIFLILESDDIGGSGTEKRQKIHLVDLLKWLQMSEQTHNVVVPLFASSIELCFRNLNNVKNNGIKQIVADNNISLQNTSKTETQPGIDTISINDLSLPFHQTLNVQLNSVLGSMKTKTSQKDLVNIMKHNLVASVAQSLQISKVILPEDQTNLAIKMFTIMSLGRGAQLSEQMGFTTTMVSREGGAVTFARPLMDFVSDDLREYLLCLPQEYSEGLFNGSSPTKSRKMKIDSLERQCDNFIVELQSGFPSTVPTLAKIGEKICPSVSSGRSSSCSGSLLARRQCKLCKRVEEESDQDDLCYGCSNISKEMKEPELLRKLIEDKQEDWA